MKAHVEIYIRLDLDGGKTLHDVLREFAEKTKGWEFPLENSLDYQKGHGYPAGFVVSDSVKGLERGAVAIANLDPKQLNRFRVPNIVPRDSWHLTMDQYNAIGISFAKNFRQFLRMNKYGGAVKMSGPEKKLSDIIRGEKCRKLFEAWLHTPTLISHPGDIQALHVFICALFRYGSDARSYQIGQFLIEDRGWKPKAANFVVTEIEKGLAILTVNRNFHRW
ncbi:MAG: hypothetical protein ABSH11_05835 [Verrucomicrobiota bacterium]|jgi:hypothetical protein